MYTRKREKKEKERERRAKCKVRREKERKRKKTKKERKKMKEITRDRLRAKQTLCARKVRLDYRRQTSRGGKTPSLSDENEKEGRGGEERKRGSSFAVRRPQNCMPPIDIISFSPGVFREQPRTPIFFLITLFAWRRVYARAPSVIIFPLNTQTTLASTSREQPKRRKYGHTRYSSLKIRLYVAFLGF